MVRARAIRSVGIRAGLLLLASSAACSNAGLADVDPPPGALHSGGAGAGAGAAGQGGAPPVTPAPERGPPGAQLFVPDQVLQIHLTLSAADRTLLEEHGDDEVYVPAQATLSGTGLGTVELGEVGLRHKGAYSLHHCWDDNGGVRTRMGTCQRLSYKLKFDEYQPDVRLDGLKRLNLHASSGDDTRLHELIAYETFRAFDVDAPRTAIAQVYVNGALEGLFIAVEAIDGRYTKAHFPEGGGDGNLYKEIWPSPALQTGPLREALTTNEELGDVSAFRAFASAVAGSSADSFASTMASWVDLEHTLRYIAVDRALKNWDGIMAFYAPSTPHNFYWYHDSGGSGRFQLIPWDLDNTFWEFDPYMAPQDWVSAPPVPDWNVEPSDCNERSIWSAGNSEGITPPRCDRFLGHLARTHWSRFEEVAAELLEGPFALSHLQQRAHHYRDLLRPIIAADPLLVEHRWLSEVQAFDTTLADSVDDFRAFVSRGLSTEQAGPALTEAVLDRGLEVALSNGFEFTSGSPGTAPAGTFDYGAEGTTVATQLNGIGAIAGEYDLRFDFTFTRQPGVYDEWVNFGYATVGGQEVDIRGKSTLVLSLRADRTRNVRIRLNSPAYEDAFGDVWSEFGVNVPVTTTSTTVELPLDSFAYPSWARDEWTAGQGWTGSDAEAAGLVRSRFTGLIFAPSATTNGNGELVAVSETGFLQVDDIRLE